MGLDLVEARIKVACAACDRARGEVTLIAVTKTRNREEIQPLLDHGLRDFGEARVAEAEEKWADLRRDVPDIRLHMIGQLQSNKAAEALRLFDVIHTLDRSSLAEALAKEIARQKKTPRLFIQVNTGEEPQKAGILPQDLASLIAQARDLALPIEGLTCLPPVNEPPAFHFALLREKAKNFGFKNLSMGMSTDYETAIRWGATHLRIGSALFE